MNNRYNRYQPKRQYNKSDSFDKKNRLISVLVVLSLSLLFIINHLHYENESLRDEMEMLSNEISERDKVISSMTKEIESLKPKNKVIEKEKPKFFFTRTKKDTTKTPVSPIVVPVVTTPVDTNSHQ